MRVQSLFFAMIATVSAFGGSGLLPHVAADRASFATEVVLENQSQSKQTIYLTAQSSAGNYLSQVAVDLEPNSRKVMAVADLFEDQTVAYLRYDAPPLASAALAFVPLANPANRAVIAGSDRQAKNWRLYPGNWTTTFDGLAIVNSSCGSDAVVTAKQFDVSGALIDTADLAEPLQSGGKTIVNLADLFTYQVGSYVEITSNKPLQVMALKGTLNPNSEQAFLLGGNVEARMDFQDLYQEALINQVKWSEEGTGGTYQMQTQFLCFCPEDVVQPVQVEVLNGEIQTMTYVNGGESVPLSLVERYHTVDQLFELIFTTIENGVDHISVEFDPDNGAPTQINIDPSTCIADEEYSIRVLSVQKP